MSFIATMRAAWRCACSALPMHRLMLVTLLACGTPAVAAAQEGEAQRDSAAAAPQPVREAKIGEGKFVKGTPLPAWARPLSEIPATSRTNPIVIRLAESQLNVAPVQGYLVHRAIQVNNASALGQLGQYPIAFVPDYQRIELHQLRILRDGAVIDRLPSVNVRFLERETGLEGGVYSGMVTAMLLIEDVRVGDTLHIVYTTHGSNPVFGQTYAGAASWDQTDPVERRRVTLISPANRAIRWRMHGDFRSARVQPQESQEGGMRVLRFEEQGFEGLDSEPYTSLDYFPYRWLQFSEYADWAAVAQWALGMFPPLESPPASLQPVVDRLKALPTADARVAAALQWVQDEVRYFSVSLGESSHRPYPPAQVVERRYGDCKDKTYLLIVLLQAVGVDARPILVATDRPRSVSRMLPTPDVFDHVVARVVLDGNAYYLDGTRLGQRGQLAYMGNALQGHEGLVVEAGTSGLTLIDAANAQELATYDLTEEFSLPDLKQDGKLTATRTLRGVAAEVVRLAYANLTAEQRRKDAAAPYERSYPGIAIEGDPQLDDDLDRNTLRITTRFNVPQLAREFRGDWAVRFFPGNLRGIFNLPQKVDRNFPVALTRLPYRARYSVRVHWPENVSMIHDPSAQRLSNDFFVLDVQHGFRGNVSSTRVDFLPRKEVVSPRELRTLFEELQKVDRYIRGVSIAEKGAFKNTGFLSLSTASLQQNIAARLQRSVATLTRTLDEKRLSGDDLAEALCTRAEAHSDLGKRAEALADASEAVRIAPSLGRAWVCRGNVHFAAGDFARAIPDYTKALSFGEDPFFVYYRRGHARFYVGQFAAAAEDFARAAQTKTETDQRNRDFARLWQVWSLRRDGQPLPDALETELRGYAEQPWPRPALALMTKAITPERLLAEVQKKSGDEREMMLAEAWFYLGQFHLIEGDKARAREAFENARAQGIVVYIEHVAAGFELAQLK